MFCMVPFWLTPKMMSTLGGMFMLPAAFWLLLTLFGAKACGPHEERASTVVSTAANSIAIFVLAGRMHLLLSHVFFIIGSSLKP